MSHACVAALLVAFAAQPAAAFCCGRCRDQHVLEAFEVLDEQRVQRSVVVDHQDSVLFLAAHLLFSATIGSSRAARSAG